MQKLEGHLYYSTKHISLDQETILPDDSMAVVLIGGVILSLNKLYNF
jgi:hypothetical protein